METAKQQLKRNAGDESYLVSKSDKVCSHYLGYSVNCTLLKYDIGA